MSANESETYVITGGTAGIGRELVRQAAEAGHRVVTCGRSVAELAAIEVAHPGVVAIACDLSDATDRERFAARVAGECDGIDVLINNAGIQIAYRLEDVAAHEAELARELAVNLVAPLALAHALMPQLRRRSGRVVNVSSGLAYVPSRRCPHYAATKAALSHYSRSVRLQEPGVAFSEVVLPLVDTEMTRGRGSGKIAASDAAAQILAGIARGRSTIRVGKARLLPVLRWLAPGLLTRMLNRDAPVANAAATA